MHEKTERFTHSVLLSRRSDGRTSFYLKNYVLILIHAKNVQVLDGRDFIVRIENLRPGLGRYTTHGIVVHVKK